MTVHLPLDLTSLPPFRGLEAELGTARALWLWWLVWRELAYLAQEGGAPGRVREEDRAAFVQALSVPSVERGSVEPGPAMWELLLRSRLLKEDGRDFVCVRFANLHGASCLPRSQAQRGGDMRAYHQRQKHAPQDAFQQALSLPEDKMVDADHQPLSEEQRKRVTLLIVTCDNALHKPQRPVHGYSEGLVQDALRVIARFSDEEIDRVCLFVAGHRTNVMLSTTEKLLPQFGEIVRLLEGQG